MVDGKLRYYDEKLGSIKMDLANVENNYKEVSDKLKDDSKKAEIEKKYISYITALVPIESMTCLKS